MFRWDVWASRGGSEAERSTIPIGLVLGTPGDGSERSGHFTFVGWCGVKLGVM